MELVDHPNDEEHIDFEAEFLCLMIADIEDAHADIMLGQYEKVPELMFLSDDVQLDGLCLHNHHLRKLPHQWIMV